MPPKFITQRPSTAKYFRGVKPIVNRQVERMEDMPTLNDIHTQRIMEYLTGKGWSKAEILDFINFITQINSTK